MRLPEPVFARKFTRSLQSTNLKGQEKNQHFCCFTVHEFVIINALPGEYETGQSFRLSAVSKRCFLSFLESVVTKKAPT